MGCLVRVFSQIAVFVVFCCCFRWLKPYPRWPRLAADSRFVKTSNQICFETHESSRDRPSISMFVFFAIVLLFICWRLVGIDFHSCKRPARPTNGCSGLAKHGVVHRLYLTSINFDVGLQSLGFRLGSAKTSISIVGLIYIFFLLAFLCLLIDCHTY